MEVGYGGWWRLKHYVRRGVDHRRMPVCHHVARITYRPRTSGDGHSDDEDPYERRAD